MRKFGLSFLIILLTAGLAAVSQVIGIPWLLVIPAAGTILWKPSRSLLTTLHFSSTLIFSLAFAVTYGTLFATRPFFSQLWFMAPLGLLALSSVLCLVERFPKTRRIPYILIHLSIIVVALGATMRTYAKKEGMLHLVIGQASNKLLVMEDGTGTNRVEILPFSVRLDKFDVEFYESTPMVYAFLAGSERPVAALDLSKGEEATVAGMLIRTKGLRTVKIAPAAGHDPVDVEVAVVEFNGQEGVLVEGDPVGNDRLALVYQNQDGEVKLYQSRLTILDEAGNEVVTKDVLVNHPLLQAGWWLYQSNWNPRDLRYSGIHAVYDPGLPVAVIGLVMLVLGTLLIVRIKRRKKEVAS